MYIYVYKYIYIYICIYLPIHTISMSSTRDIKGEREKEKAGWPPLLPRDVIVTIDYHK